MLIAVNSIDRCWKKNSFVFTHQYHDPCLVYADSFDVALDEYSLYLTTYAPGLLIALGGEEHKKLVDDYCQNNKINIELVSDDRRYDIYDKSEEGLTRTEAGFLVSHEWGIAFENPQRRELKKYVEAHGGSRAPRRLWPGWRVANNGLICEIRHSHLTECGDHLSPTVERVYTKVTCLGCLAGKNAT